MKIINTRKLLLSVSIVGMAMTTFAFQNCSKVGFTSPTSADLSSSLGNTDKYSLTASVSPSVQLSGLPVTISAAVQNLTSISYSCVGTVDPTITLSGSIDISALQTTFPLPADLTCDLVGHNDQDPNFKDIHADVSVSMECGNQIKVGGKCIDFSCQSVVELTADQLTNIPERTADGICYAYKVISSVKSGASSLTTTKDADVISANHTAGSGNWNPYLMGQFQANFLINGARVVKLAGGLDATTPIQVDNFVLFGVYPAGTSISDYSQYYSAQGTSDSGVYNSSNVHSANILFHNQALTLTPYGSGGTSSIAPINISTAAQIGSMNTLDIRAEDCGGSRALSDIYLLFQ